MSGDKKVTKFNMVKVYLDNRATADLIRESIMVSLRYKIRKDSSEYCITLANWENLNCVVVSKFR